MTVQIWADLVGILQSVVVRSIKVRNAADRRVRGSGVAMAAISRCSMPIGQGCVQWDKTSRGRESNKRAELVVAIQKRMQRQRQDGDSTTLKGDGPGRRRRGKIECQRGVEGNGV